MLIKKRNGKAERLSFDKINYRLKKLCNDITLGKLKRIDPDIIVQKVVSSIYDGVSSVELDEEAARIAVSLTENMEYQQLASRIIISNLHKNTMECFSEVINKLYTNTDNSDNPQPIIADDVYKIINENKDILNSAIDYTRDYKFDYFGYKTLERGYLLKMFNKELNKMIVIERPQHMYMRIAIGIHKTDITSALKTYDLISQHYYTHASPTMFNSGTRLSNLSSCFLLGTHDSIEGIFKTVTDCARISKVGGGIGVHISNVRSNGSIIRGTNGVSDGIVPMLKVYNTCSTYVNQCFTPDTIVYSKNGPVQMRDITKKDELITIDGTFKKVNEIITNYVDKEILEIGIENGLMPVKVTKEHELYLIKNQKKAITYSSIKDKLNNGVIKPDFYNAGELSEDDLVGFPIPTYEKDNKIDDLDYYKFYGIMLSNGYICKETGEYSVQTPCEEMQNFIREYLNRKKISYGESGENCIIIESEKLEIKRDMLYDLDNEKAINVNFLHLPVNKILKILQGLLIKNLMFASSSQKLIMQLRYMFLRLGILISGCFNEELQKYCLRIPNCITEKLIWNGIVWSRVKSIKQTNYIGKVYDFEMIDNHNYLTDMGLVHNSGKRKGSFAIYIEPYHADILEFLDMKKNQGHDDVRARDLFYAIWAPDLFMKQVECDGDWYLMCPDESPGLNEVYGDEFEVLYWKYVEEKRYKKVIKAQEVWKKILESQIETGVPYIAYKDAVNKKCNQKNLGTIKSSNLCLEISLFSNDKEYAVCNLSSVALPKYVEYNSEGKAFFNHERLKEVAEYMMEPMNKVIDNNYYPTPETKLSNFRHRPLGIGVQGLADVYFKMGMPFESLEAKQLNKEIFETLYYGCLTGSLEQAKRDGQYETFSSSPFSEGKLQFDLAEEYDGIDKSKYLSGRWDWDTLKEEIKKYGVRNSMLTALMPTASSAQIMGNTEAFEPIDSCIFKRRVLSGEYMVINKYLVAELDKLGLWSKDMKDLIIANDGSIQNIDNIPVSIKAVYKTVWELSMKSVIEQASDRGVFIDQMQSMNLFVSNPTYKKLTSMHFYAWKHNLKSGMYYLRSKSSASAGKFSIDANLEKKIRDDKKEAMLKDEPEECLMCSS